MREEHWCIGSSVSPYTLPRLLHPGEVTPASLYLSTEDNIQLVDVSLSVILLSHERQLHATRNLSSSSGHCDEEVRLSMRMDNGRGILIMMIHIVRATGKRRSWVKRTHSCAACCSHCRISLLLLLTLLCWLS
ncbi:hypothetical protein Y1Q_0021125 [Alligator mississippiensis]|uniref:Uncharacterized protein n=1 Tax=Alligator mississippiensis TaxID=8496 RepID=A0A151NS98_ALLMI|nr:hypothetical protein Y1Q_0021125 [Alligator mississippiensis]